MSTTEAEGMEDERLLTASEVADILRVATDSVYRAARDDGLPCVRINRSVRFRPSDVREFIRNGGTPGEGAE